MQVNQSISLLKESDDAVILPLSEGLPELKSFQKQIGKPLFKAIQTLQKNNSFTGKSNETAVLSFNPELKTDHLILVGLGQTPGYRAYREAAGESVRLAQRLGCETAAFYMGVFPDWDDSKMASAIAEGWVMGAYAFLGYKSANHSPKKPVNLRALVSESGRVSGIQKGLKQGQIIGDAVNHARNLANTPANLLTPKAMVDHVKETFKSIKSVSLDVIDAKKAKSLGMGSFLGVAAGSDEPAFMVVMRYTGKTKAKTKPLVLVGKGVTFDSGGISIKPALKMSDMKADMSGSAAVVATLKAAAQLGITQPVTGIIALTENMPSGSALKPGDVLTSMSGKTIEILNTDAEGRLILADALTLAVRQENPKAIVDVATLTGACSVALGTEAAAILGNDASLIQRFIAYGDHYSGEKLWQLPLYDGYLELLKSDVADLANCHEGRLAGTCSAAKFLEQFVEKTPWVHLDIASIMDYSKTKGHCVKGMSGAGTQSLIGFVLNQ